MQYVELAHCAWGAHFLVGPRIIYLFISIPNMRHHLGSLGTWAEIQFKKKKKKGGREEWGKEQTFSPAPRQMAVTKAGNTGRKNWHKRNKNSAGAHCLQLHGELERIYRTESSQSPAMIKRGCSCRSSCKALHRQGVPANRTPSKPSGDNTKPLSGCGLLHSRIYENPPPPMSKHLHFS